MKGIISEETEFKSRLLIKQFPDKNKKERDLENNDLLKNETKKKVGKVKEVIKEKKEIKNNKLKKLKSFKLQLLYKPSQVKLSDKEIISIREQLSNLNKNSSGSVAICAFKIVDVNEAFEVFSRTSSSDFQN